MESYKVLLINWKKIWNNTFPEKEIPLIHMQPSCLHFDIFSRTTAIVLLYFWNKIIVMQVPSQTIDCIRKVFIVPKYYVRISGWARKYYEYNWIKTRYLYLSGLASKGLDIISSYKLSSILVYETLQDSLM